MKRLRALLIDDEFLARQRLLAMLARESDVEIVGECASGAEAVAAILEKHPDLVFLDVQMPGLDGFGVLRCTVGAWRPIVIFVTAFDQHAIRAFEVHAADYLLKPVTAARLHEAVRHAVERRASAPTQEEARVIDSVLAAAPRTPVRIPLSGETGTTLVDIDDIQWIEADGNHLAVHTANVTHRIRETIAAMEARLAPLGFARIHRSSIVNIRAVRTVESIPKGGYYLILENGVRVRAGRGFREAVQGLIK